MRSGLLIPLFLHTCVAAVVGNAPVKFEALIFFTFNDINKNVRPQAPQAAQAPMCHSTRPRKDLNSSNGKLMQQFCLSSQ